MNTSLQDFVLSVPSIFYVLVGKLVFLFNEMYVGLFCSINSWYIHVTHCFSHYEPLKKTPSAAINSYFISYMQFTQCSSMHRNFHLLEQL